ncbi:WhiB family transcriptional regulator [Rhodococcus qingshengii]|uniref:WhiB family transcriptional regulator n=1 Tax=Rhodococcus qingshengii TaxID=334542 RepID=UPI0022B38244|nr:WhiB family transcriptional regulator [Rhodococcus qingshengii]MCZ4618624.1 WhiB family transcriptional regulator [Rhodococcus qingshengii]
MHHKLDTARFPRPRTDDWDWQLKARCREIDTATFYPSPRLRGTTRQEFEEKAKQICTLCPVRTPCLRHALVSKEPYGIWGGLSANERTALLNPVANPASTSKVRTIGKPVRQYVKRVNM